MSPKAITTTLGVGVTKPISSVSLFPEIFSIVKTHVGYWVSRLYLTGVAAAQLRWHLSNINVIHLDNLRSNILLAEKLTSGALGPPPPPPPPQTHEFNIWSMFCPCNCHAALCYNGPWYNETRLQHVPSMYWVLAEVKTASIIYRHRHVAYFTREVSPSLAKPPLNFNDGLAFFCTEPLSFCLAKISFPHKSYWYR